jgi:hypothetical protein
MPSLVVTKQKSSATATREREFLEPISSSTMFLARLQFSRRPVRKVVEPQTYISADQPHGAPADPLVREGPRTICFDGEFDTQCPVRRSSL